MTVAVCLGSLSCCKMNLEPIRRLPVCTGDGEESKHLKCLRLLHSTVLLVLNYLKPSCTAILCYLLAIYSIEL